MFFSLGVRYMLLSIFLFQLMNVCVKIIPHIPAVEIILFRSIISLVISYGLLKIQHVPIWGNRKGWLILRGAAGAIALMLYFSLLHQIPLASTVAMQYLAPIFMSVIGIFMVREKVAPVQWLFFLMSFVGVLMIRGFDTRIAPEHLAVGIIASLFMALAYNVIRKLNTTEHPLVIIFYFPLVTLPFALAYSVFNWVQPVGWDWLVLLMVGLLTQFAQYFMTKSFQTEEIAKVAPISYLGIIFAIFFGFAFGEHFNLFTYIGMLLVLVGIVLNIVVKNREKKVPA